MQKTLRTNATLVAIGILAPCSAMAASVSWNANVFGDTSTDGSANAGVVASSYWNDT